uniref:Uncharacterized protein n=1 Tax=Knipowitschia caucasica TaxID=637954 RepID=A0AAV2LSH6_KNICA
MPHRQWTLKRADGQAFVRLCVLEVRLGYTFLEWGSPREEILSTKNDAILDGAFGVIPGQGHEVEGCECSVILKKELSSLCKESRNCREYKY